MPESALVQYMKDKERGELASEALRPAPTVAKYVFGGGIIGALLGTAAGYGLSSHRLSIPIGAATGGALGAFTGGYRMMDLGRRIATAQQLLTLPPRKLDAELKERALRKFYTPEQYEAYKMDMESR